eukprot:jgi/Ulvmu1/11353/UM075_0013.1
MMLSVRVTPCKAIASLPAVPAAARRAVAVRAKTDSSEELYEKTEKVVADIKDKWEKTEEKPALIGLITASIVLLYVLNGIVSAVDQIPVVSGIFELIGIFVSSWFVYRYLVFGPDRQELKQNIQDFFKKVQGKA